MGFATGTLLCGRYVSRRSCPFSPYFWIPSDAKYGKDDCVLTAHAKINGVRKVPEAYSLNVTELDSASLR